MEDNELFKELNKILSLEHGHLGMYENHLNHDDVDIRRTFRRFMEIETEHIERLKQVLRHLGASPSIVVEGGDIFGRLLGISTKVAGDKEMMKVYNFIEKKSHEGYSKFVSKLEHDGDRRNQFLAEIAASNMLEAKLMHLWLEDKLSRIH